MSDGLIKQFTDATIGLLTTHSGIFLPEGLSILRGIAIILVIWHGFHIAYGGSTHGLINGLVQIAICFSLLTFYDRPFPGTNTNLHQVMTDYGSWLAQQVDNNLQEEVGRKLADFQAQIPRPIGAEILNFGSMIQYWTVIGLIALSELVIIAVLGIGPVVQGMLILIGPIMIPLSLIPPLSFLAWGWFRSLIQFSLYPFFGNAFIYVFAQVWMHFFEQHSGPVDSTTVAAIFMQVVILAGVFIWGIKQLPAIIAGICSGGGSHGWLPKIGIW